MSTLGFHSLTQFEKKNRIGFTITTFTEILDRAVSVLPCYQKIRYGNNTRRDGSDAAHVAALGGAADGHGNHQIGQDGAKWLWDGARWAGIVVMTTEND